MNNWIKKQLTNIAIAMANVERNSLSQEGLDLSSEAPITQTKNQHSVMHSLLRGEITEEVEQLRWRMYMNYTEAAKITHKVIGYDEEGYPIMEQTYVGHEARLNAIKTDDSDDAELFMVVDNTPIDLSIEDTLGMVNDDNIVLSANSVDITNLILENFLPNEDNVDTNDTDDADKLGVTSNIQLSDLINMSAVTIADNIKIDSTKERTYPITLSRESKPKFELEKFTKKLHVKRFNDKYLLEFYTDRYPDEFGSTSRFFISAIKKLKENPRRDAILEIDTVHFISSDTVGVPDFLEFEYKIEKLHNITEFNQYLVIKFVADAVKNGENIVEKYRKSELDEKYKNKEKR